MEHKIFKNMVLRTNRKNVELDLLKRYTTLFALRHLLDGGIDKRFTSTNNALTGLPYHLKRLMNDWFIVDKSIEPEDDEAFLEDLGDPETPAASERGQQRERHREADQKDREGPITQSIDWTVVSARDAERRNRVREIIKSGRVRTGKDYERAAMYLRKTANNAIRRFAYREAVGLARRGLELIATLPNTAERAEQERVRRADEERLRLAGVEEGDDLVRSVADHAGRGLRVVDVPLTLGQDHEATTGRRWGGHGRRSPPRAVRRRATRSERSRAGR